MPAQALQYRGLGRRNDGRNDGRNDARNANPAVTPSVQLPAAVTITVPANRQWTATNIRVNEGDTVHLTATVENTQDKGQGMAVAIIGLPAGLTLPEDMKQLKDLARPRNGGKEPGVISAWETRGREVILYWRSLAPGV